MVVENIMQLSGMAGTVKCTCFQTPAKMTLGTFWPKDPKWPKDPIGVLVPFFLFHPPFSPRTSVRYTSVGLTWTPVQGSGANYGYWSLPHGVG